jgi:hypothetical protein
MPQGAPPNGGASAGRALSAADRVAEMQAKLHRWAAQRLTTETVESRMR